MRLAGVLAGLSRPGPPCDLVGGLGQGRSSQHPTAVAGAAACLLLGADPRRLRAPCAHRSALTPDRAEEELLREARAGSLDAEAVGAVLAAAGHEAVDGGKACSACLPLPQQTPMLEGEHPRASLISRSGPLRGRHAYLRWG